eukprot:c10164_g1_i1.p1 GENE.c10164_g1_i1~~c10164_g1_i1.p1  ORF type:complete len:357 (-),score=69.13 c10164_g1_i1:62-1132(-)
MQKPASPIKNPLSGKGSVKKGGAGGKGSWGVPGDELEVSGLEQSDPVYDPDDEPFTLDPFRPKLPGSQYKLVVDDILSSFIAGTKTVQEAASQLDSIDAPLYQFYIVSKLVKLGLPSRKDEVAFLLKYLCSSARGLIHKDHLVRGLGDAFLHMEEWNLDAPNFSDALIALTKDLVETDLLMSSFLSSNLSMLEHRSELKSRIDRALEEFFQEFDFTEFTKTLKELDCSPFHGQVIKYVIRSAIEKPVGKIEKGAQLLSNVSGPHQPVTMLQVMQGVELVLAECEDLALDNPRCKEVLSQLIARLIVDESLPPSFLDHVFAVAQGDVGQEVLNMATELLNEPGAAQRVRSLWDSTEQ